MLKRQKDMKNVDRYGDMWCTNVLSFWFRNEKSQNGIWEVKLKQTLTVLPSTEK